MKKTSKITALFASIALFIVTMISFGFNLPVAQADGEHTHDGMTAWESATSLPTSGSYYLTSDVRISSTCVISGTLNLCLNSHGIIFTGTDATKGSVFNVGNGKTLNLYDCGEIEHKFRMKEITTYTDIPTTSRAGLAEVDDTLTEDYETFTGGYITGGIGSLKNDTYYNGGAIVVDVGTFNMYGGTIIGNTCKGSGSDPSNRGGAVALLGGRFTMYDGAIIGNTTDTSTQYSYDNGGGVFANLTNVNGSYVNAYFTMNGGTIARNSAYMGGGISISTKIGANGVWFTANGGSVKDNIALSMGAGLYIQCSTINLTNFEVSGNIGSGILASGSTYKDNGGIFNMTNCNVVENYGTAISLRGETSSYNKDNSVPGYSGSIVNSHIDRNYGSALTISGYSGISNLYGADFTISGTTISDNVLNGSGCAGLSAGITSDSYDRGSRVNLVDCEITGNVSNYRYSNSNGNNGVGMSFGKKSVMNISGKIVINDNYFHNTQTDVYEDSNLYLYDTTYASRINVAGQLAEDSHIGVVKYYAVSYGVVSGGTGPVTTGLSDNGTVGMFSADCPKFYIKEENGEAVLAEKISITYNRNTAKTGAAPATSYFIPNTTATVAGNTGEMAKPGYRFVGWNTLADGTGTMFQPGDTFEISEKLTLYAIFEHTSHDDIDFVAWTDALALEQNGSGNTASNSLPSVAGDYFLTTNVTLSATWSVPEGTTNLCFNGCSISISNGCVVYVPSSATLNLYDESDNYGKITGGKGGYDGKRGGGMYVMGTVNMYGGSIANNEAAYGGGVYLKNGNFTMYNSARIYSNKSKTSYDSWANGGGALIDGGTFTIYGGTLSYNTADREDSAIALSSGNLYIRGGSFSNNTTGMENSGCIRNYGSGNIYISGSPYIFNNNITINSNSKASNMLILNGKKLIIDGELGQNAKIGVTVQASGAFTSGLSGNGTISNFSSDNATYKVVEDKGEALLLDVNTIAVIISGDNSSYYTSFATALSNWADGDTLKLLGDVSGTQVTTSGGTKILDLNNYSITYTGGSVVYVTGGTLTIQDSSENKTKHYYTPNQTGMATLSISTTNYFFEGGYITGSGATSDRGGGLKVSGGDVYFISGTIFACSAGWGGGIWTGGGNGSLTISDTASVIGCYSSGGYTSGGGMFLEGVCNVYMTGGSIRHNSSQFSGGGVRVSLQETTGTYFTMTGGEITGNYSGSHQGSGLALDMANRIKIGGSARIYGNDGDNLFLKNGGYLTIVEEFTQDALIIIRTQTLPTQDNSIVITDGWTTVMEDGDFSNIFKWNDENYRIKKNASGELVASMLHVHNWVYTADGAVITATCESGEECTMASQTITIVVQGKIYDSTAVVATLEISTGWTAVNGLASIPSIVYSGNINAGTYTASLTIGDAVASKEFTITPATATVTITGHNNVTHYDNNVHAIEGYDAVVDSNLYNLDDVSFSGTATAERTNAGTTTMGLDESLFSNENDNFVVTFVVTDGYQTILTVDAIIIKAPVAKQIDFNWLQQELVVAGEVTGGAIHYALCNSADEVPDAESYSTSIPTAKNAGTYYIWYKVIADMNHNDLEASRVTSTVLRVNAVITKSPVAKDCVINNQDQELVIAGEAVGGTILYSLKTSSVEIPDANDYAGALPVATNAGYYYVWYKVVADQNHIDLPSVRLTSTLFEEEWVVLSGVVYQSDGETEVAGAKVTLTKGNKVVVAKTTDDEGHYEFILPADAYNIIYEFDANVETSLVRVFADTQQDASMFGGKTESLLQIDAGDEQYSGITVGGLNDEAHYIRDSENIPSSQTVSVLMVVEAKSQEEASKAEDIIAVAENKSLDFLDVKVKKTIDSTTTILDTTANVLEIVVPYEKINRHNIVVYSYHDASVRTFIELADGESVADGTYRIDKDNKLVYIYTSCFSTFAIGYTPHYKVSTTLSLGSYEGIVNISLTSQTDGTVYTLDNVLVGEVNFDDVPMGQYMMTVTWEDGVVNTLTMPIKISFSVTSYVPDNTGTGDNEPTSTKVEEEPFVFDDFVTTLSVENACQDCPVVIDASTDNCEDDVIYAEYTAVTTSRESVTFDAKEEDRCAVIPSDSENDVESLSILKQKGLKLTFKLEEATPIQKQTIIINQDNKAVLKLKNVANK